MSVKIKIPGVFQKFTANKGCVEIELNQPVQIKHLLDKLEVLCPGIKNGMYDDCGKLNRFLTVYLNDKDIKNLKGDLTTVNDKDKITIASIIVEG